MGVWLDFVLEPLIGEALEHSTHGRRDADDAPDQHAQGYRLAASIAYLLVSQWPHQVEILGTAPRCRTDFQELLGDHALPLDNDREDRSRPDHHDRTGDELTYVVVCAMDIAETVIKAYDGVDIGASLRNAGPAIRFADSLTEIGDHSDESTIRSLQRQLETMGEIADAVRSEADLDTPEAVRVRKPALWGQRPALIGTGLLASALVVATVFLITFAGSSKETNAQSVTSTVTTQVTSTLPPPTIEKPREVSAGSTKGVVYNVLELVSAETADGSQSTAASPWGTTATPIVLYPYDSQRRTFRIRVALRVERPQPYDVKVNVTFSKPGGLIFAANSTFLSDRRGKDVEQDEPKGQPIVLTLAGNGTPTIYSTDVYVRETENVVVSDPDKPQELAVFTCGVNVLRFGVLLAADQKDAVNLTVEMPLFVVKNCG